MTETPSSVTPVEIVNEVEQSYLNYAMSVIAGRALPDCRDGLKPVHRRILFAMNELKNYFSKPHKKSARIVGDVTGKYHPHGESSIYEAIVRMAQSFSMRHMIIDGQGNFGSIDGDSAAAMRYTEIRLQNYAMAMMEDIDKDTVNFSPNYDGTEKMPDVMPTKVPNFLINGASGIAVGMATQVPTHNLKEVLLGFLHYMRNPECTVADLMNFIKGPDFPTGGTMLGMDGVIKAYKTGRGRFYLRAVSEFETIGQKQAIIIKELPYQVNKARTVEKIAQLVREKKIEGISALRDESDREGMRVVIEVKKDANEKVILNQLLNMTQLQISFSVNMIGLVNNQPKTLTLIEIFKNFLKHRIEVITRKARYELNKVRHKAHSLEGLSVALDNLDPILELIKSSTSAAQAKEKLIGQSWPTSTVDGLISDIKDVLLIKENLPYGLENSTYQLSEKQAESILEMKLHKLTSMERDKIKKDYAHCIEQIRDFLDILRNPERRLQMIEEQTHALIKQFDSPRKTQIEFDEQFDIIDEDLIAPEEKVVSLSESGYIKVQALDTFENQNRGGRGKAASKLKDEDRIAHLISAHSHDHMMFFTSFGRVYQKRVFELPQASRTSLGKPLVNFLNLQKNEKVTTMLPLKSFDCANGQAFMFVTQRGKIKAVTLDKFAQIRSNGVIAMPLQEDDSLTHAFLITAQSKVMLISRLGKAVVFDAAQVRTMGRTAMGVNSMRLDGADDRIVSAFQAGDDKEEDAQIVIISEKGFGKRNSLSDFRVTGRSAKGSIAMKCNEKTGLLLGAAFVKEQDSDLIFMTEQGILLRTSVENISRVKSRSAMGVKLIKLDPQDRLASFELCMAVEDTEDSLDEQTLNEETQADLKCQNQDDDISKEDQVNDQNTNDPNTEQ